MNDPGFHGGGRPAGPAPASVDAPVPATFDPACYRACNPDLAALDDAAAAAHYAATGRAAGLIASPLATREAMVERIARASSVLEIGPFCYPLVRGAHVDYLDILDAAALRQRAHALGIDPAGCPERIHHVGALADVQRRYDAIVSSHAIEHQPDLVRHLEQTARLLDAGGRYYLVVPDKRYCLDHFIAESTVAEILAAWREERSVHRLSSVIEHGALTTHNDAVRHWRGDHGTLTPADRHARIRDALLRYEAAEGGYVDVHAWYFTPDSLRTILATLADLGLSAFDATVYDTPRDRLEFCAVLERRRPPRRSPSRMHKMDIVFFQSADPFRYAGMLGITAPNVIEYCRRQGFRYESFVGIKRGVWAWQASYNRIAQYRELLDRGFTGWAIHLDADAWIADLDFDLPAYLADKRDRAAIVAHSGATDAAWDINDGIVLINLGHPEGRRLIGRWWESFHAIGDAELAAAREWLGTGNDQDLIQRILRDDAAIAAAVLVEDRTLLNSRHARFIRQHLRSETADIAQRTAAIAAEVEALFRLDRMAAGRPEPDPDERARWTRRHPVGLEPKLVVAPTVAALPAVAERVIAGWSADADRATLSPAPAAFAAMLDARDADGVATYMAAFGRMPLAQGHLGGARQHRRAAEDPAFAYRRALVTYDALVSLAEATGARPIEHPELDAWGGNVRVPAATLIAAVGSMLGIDVRPPHAIGGYLGIEAGGTMILHLRMIEAIHAAWRMRQVTELLGLSGVIEVGGGAGLRALYAHRLGVHGLGIVDAPVMAAVQAYVLIAALGDSDARGVRMIGSERLDAWPAAAAELLFNEETIPGMPRDDAIALLRTARARGVRAILSVDREARDSPAIPRPTMRALVAEAGGFRLAQRMPHAIRPGFVEELFVLPETAGKR